MTITTPNVWFIGQLPPPLTGLTAVNAEVAAALSDRRPLRLVDVSPMSGGSPLTRKVGRSQKVIRGLWAFRPRRGAQRERVYMPCDGGSGLLFNILFAIVARLRGAQLFLHHHSFAYISQRSVLMDALIRVAPKRTTHVVLCPEMGRGLRARYARSWRSRDARLFVLSNGFITGPVSAEARQRRSLSLCHLSNLTPEKGILRFLELFDRLRSLGLDVTAVLGGPATDAMVVSAINACAVKHEGRFRWLGPVYGADKAELLKSGDVFVFPTAYINEAQPLVLLEALAAGMPILTIARGCIGCDYDDRVGLVAADATEFLDVAVAWIRGVIDNPGRLEEYRQAAIKTAAAQRAESLAQLDLLISKMTQLA